MNLFAKLFLETAGIIVGITLIAQILGAIFIKDMKDSDDE